MSEHNEIIRAIRKGDTAAVQKGLDRNWSSGFERISRLIENRVSCAPSRRPAHARKYLEYRITADDPKALAKPYTYTVLPAEHYGAEGRLL